MITDETEEKDFAEGLIMRKRRSFINEFKKVVVEAMVGEQTGGGDIIDEGEEIVEQ